MRQEIEAIFFDFGNTIAFQDKNFRKSEAKALLEIIKKHGFNINESSFVDLFMRLSREKYYKALESLTFQETKMEDLLLEVFSTLNIDVKYKEILTIVDKLSNLPFHVPDKNANLVLKELKKRGYKLGVISNARTHIPKRAIEKFGMNDFFDIIILSRDVGIMKPGRKIFNIALEALNVEAQNAVHIGDLICIDVCGAKKSGLKAVLRLYGEQPQFPASLMEYCVDSKANFIVHDLRELLDIFDGI